MSSSRVCRRQLALVEHLVNNHSYNLFVYLVMCFCSDDVMMYFTRWVIVLKLCWYEILTVGKIKCNPSKTEFYRKERTVFQIYVAFIRTKIDFWRDKVICWLCYYLTRTSISWLNKIIWSRCIIYGPLTRFHQKLDFAKIKVKSNDLSVVL